MQTRMENEGRAMETAGANGQDLEVISAGERKIYRDTLYERTGAPAKRRA